MKRKLVLLPLLTAVAVTSLAVLCFAANIRFGQRRPAVFSVSAPGGDFPAGTPDQSGALSSAGVEQAGGGRGRNLSLQPEALKLGRKLGRRFAAPGREVTQLEGTLNAGGEARRVRIIRRREEGGEFVEVEFPGRGAPLFWDGLRGGPAAGSLVPAEDAALLERIALDSPDHFVLAQVYGAAYQLVARNVRAESGGSNGYAGALYDVVRVSEQTPEAVGAGPGPWRLYYLNSVTGLLDKVVSEEGGEQIEAALSGWAEHAGELQPSRVTWSRQGQVFMELAITNAAHGPKR